MSKSENISIFSCEDNDDRGAFEYINQLRFGRSEVSVELLREHINTLLNNMTNVLQNVKADIAGYSVDTVTIAVEISATGRVSLMGTGGDIAGKGGLTFTLKRIPPNK